MRLLIALLATCVNASVFANSGTIQGTVAGISGAPVVNGSVDVAINGAVYGTWLLDDQGAFSNIVSWVGSTPASVAVHTNAPYYVDQTVVQSLSDGGLSDFEIRLAPADVLFADGFEP